MTTTDTQTNDLIEQVKKAISDIRELPMDGDTIPVEFGPVSVEIIARAAVLAVRKHDDEQGPSEGEIDALLASWRGDLSHSTSGRVRSALKAAARERLRQAEEAHDGD